ncbi:hypothetical protein [Absidia glauca]|uniref:Reverse transcriptase domain-containing protein n=1 Tax=Absidia glauca TaxID=4829 RepID=A0A168KLE5_ABSGL|nr:hypothetical protein [Absidia glauca]
MTPVYQPTSSGNTTSSEYEYNALVKNLVGQVSVLALIVQEIKDSVERKKNCLNCQESSHKLPDCPNPCKICQESGHASAWCLSNCRFFNSDGSTSVRPEILNGIGASLVNSEVPLKEPSLIPVLKDYLDVFGVDYCDLSTTSLVKLHMNTGDSQPIQSRPNHYMPYADLAQLKDEVATMINHEILEPALHGRGNIGGWSLPCLYIMKKDGDRRLCVQFQKLNQVTIKNPWPLPRIVDILEYFSGASIFTCLDLLKGFNQIKVADDSRAKLTVVSMG